VSLAARGQALDLGAQAQLGGQGGQAVGGAEFEVAGQLEGVDQCGGGDRRVAAVQQSPVDADVVADDDLAVEAAG
jgi:hypothetical protein